MYNSQLQLLRDQTDYWRAGSRAKALFAFHTNLFHLVEEVGIEHCALLTLCFPKGTNLKQANKAFNEAMRQFLNKLFPKWILVLEFSPSRAPHFHLVVASQHNLREGFNTEAYDQRMAITKLAKRERRPLTPAEKQSQQQLSKNLTTNPALMALSKELKKHLPRFGFGNDHPAELTPLLRGVTAIGCYLSKGLFPSKHIDTPVPRGARLIRYSRSCPRVIRKLSDVVINPEARQSYLAKRQHIMEISECADPNEMRLKFGSKWGYLCGETCEVLRQIYDREPIRWESAEVMETVTQVMNREHSFCAKEDAILDIGTIVRRDRWRDRWRRQLVALRTENVEKALKEHERQALRNPSDYLSYWDGSHAYKKWEFLPIRRLT